jgi:hypothetical protein
VLGLGLGFDFFVCFRFGKLCLYWSSTNTLLEQPAVETVGYKKFNTSVQQAWLWWTPVRDRRQ